MVNVLSNLGNGVNSQYDTNTFVQDLCSMRNMYRRAMYLCYTGDLSEYHADWDFIYRFITELLEQSDLRLEFSFSPLIYLDRYRAFDWTVLYHIIHSSVSAHFSLSPPRSKSISGYHGIMSLTAILTSFRYRSC